MDPAFPMLRWGFVFVACPLPLTESQKHDLVRLAARAWFEDEVPVHFDWPLCSGVLRASSGFVTLGSFVGQQFEAEVNIPDGDGVVSFLVTESQLRAAHQPVAEA